VDRLRHAKFVEGLSVENVDTDSLPSVLFLHGMGLGAWIWEQYQELFAKVGYSSWAIDMAGHGKYADEDPCFSDVVDGVKETIGLIDGPVVVIGHSFGGLVAQRLASEVEFSAIVLLCPTPPKEVPIIPTKYSIRHALGALPALALGRRISFPDSVYEGAGLAGLETSDRYLALGRIMSWPNRLSRELAFNRPSVLPVRIPVLSCFGGLDTIIPLRSSRLIGEYHNNAITWRFDDVGHFPTLEPAGERVALSVIDWLKSPIGRKVLEIDAFLPDDGVGHDARMKAAPIRRSNTRFGKKKKKKG